VTYIDSYDYGEVVMSTKIEKKTALVKTEVVTLRLDPKTKFGLELLSRKQYRSLSSVVEWAINYALQNGTEGIEDLDNIWDVEEADRLVKLAILQPNLLSYEEQLVWKIIKEHGYFWKGNYLNNEWTWQCRLEDAVFQLIRTHYKTILAVARQESSKMTLPAYAQIKVVNTDNDLPF
jgi:hypothetical protein